LEGVGAEAEVAGGRLEAAEKGRLEVMNLIVIASWMKREWLVWSAISVRKTLPL